MTASNESASPSARRLANEILVKVDSQKAYADILLDHTLKGAALEAADRALLTELVYGTLRWRGTIDARLQRKLRRPLSEAEPRIRNLLRLAGYQLFYLDRIPSYAAVDEAVELAKRYGGRKAASFVNGVLRNVLRDGESLPLDGSVNSLAVQYSHPAWLVRRWRAEFGAEDAAALMRANNDRAPLALRVNSLKCDREQLVNRLAQAGIEARASTISAHGIILPSAGAVENLPGFAEGFFQAQSEASQLVVELLAPRAGERMLDACAAPGGKSTYIAELQKDQGEVVAVDISARGIERIRQNAARLGLRSIRAVAVDATHALDDSFETSFDRILLDAPCSGLGTLRGHPEIKWQREETDVLRLSRLQQKLLERVAGYLKADGVMVYSTCTLTIEENERNVEAFLAAHPEFELQDAARYLSEQASPMTRGKYFQALPSRDNTDGFFAARLRKVG